MRRHRHPIDRLVLLLALGMAAGSGVAGADETEPLPEALLAARTIFVEQTLIDPKLVSRFRSELAKGERFEIVPSAAEADLIASLSAAAEYKPTLSDSGRDTEGDAPDTGGGSDAISPRPSGTVRVLEDVHLTIVTPDGDEVWTDSVPLGSLSGNSAKRLAKRLESRLAEATE